MFTRIRVERFVARVLCTACLAGLATGGVQSHARITRIVVERKVSPAFSGAVFGEVGAYEAVMGRAFGELDPQQPENAIITDITLAPRNSRGHVEYETEFYLIQPVEPKRGNGLLF